MKKVVIYHAAAPFTLSLNLIGEAQPEPCMAPIRLLELTTGASCVVTALGNSKRCLRETPRIDNFV